MEIFVGIDVSKETLDVCVRPSGKGRRTANDENGWAELAAWLGSTAPRGIPPSRRPRRHENRRTHP